MNVTMDVNGATELVRAMDRLPEQIRAAAADARYAEALAILAASQELVPVRTGLLKSTGQVELEGSARDADAPLHITYGQNGIAPYALVVHERTDTFHPHGQHHFLSEPFYAASEGMAERIAAAIRQALGG